MWIYLVGIAYILHIRLTKNSDTERRHKISHSIGRKKHTNHTPTKNDIEPHTKNANRFRFRFSAGSFDRISWVRMNVREFVYMMRNGVQTYGDGR